MNEFTKKFFCVLFTIILLLSNLYLQTAFANNQYEYIDEKGELKSIQAAIINNSTTTLSSGWYVVQGNVSTINLTVTGTVNLILSDGSTLNASATNHNAGIHLDYGNTLNIYGQSLNSGKLTAKGSGKGSGIGGNGGADGGAYKAPENGKNSGNLNIFGGNINANRIGGGDGGISVTSNDGYSTGGIGGHGGNIKLYKGTLNVSGNIGGGNGGKSEYRHGGDGGNLINLTVSGGILKAGSIGGGTGGDGKYEYQDGFGDGYVYSYGTAGNGGNGGTVNINAGKVEVSGYLGGGNAGWSSLSNLQPGRGGNGSIINISGGTTNVLGITGGGSGSPMVKSERGSDGFLSITGGSFDSKIILPVPNNGSSNGNVTVYATKVSFEGITTNENIRFILTGTTYNYGTSDLKTDLTGKVTIWLPSGVSVTNAYTLIKGYHGSVLAGSSGVLSELPPDTDKPVLSSINPQNNAINIPLNGKVILTFNEIMHDMPGNVILTPLSGDPFSLSGGLWSSNNTVYSLNYSGLIRGETYTVSISDFKDLTGNIMDISSGSKFSTILPIPYYDISFIDETGVSKTASAQLVNSSTKTLTTGWYALTSNLNLSNLTVSGDVHLILTDGYTLTVTSTEQNAAIRVKSGNKLKIYGQSQGTGTINASSTGRGAGIGGNGGIGSITGEGEDCGAIAINGGTIITNRIGGGDGADLTFVTAYRGGKGGTVMINAGTVSVSNRIGGGEGGDGATLYFIGGNGGDGSNLTIAGGNITVSGKIGGGAAGIGSDHLTHSYAKPGGPGTFTITGGSFTASSIQPVPKNGIANGNLPVYHTTVKLKGITTNKKIKSIYADMPAIYGTRDVKTDLSGGLHLWLPTNVTVSAVYTDNLYYKGSVLSASQGELIQSAIDTTIPVVLSITPETGSSEVPNSSSVSISFNKVMDVSKGIVILSSEEGEDIILSNGIWTYGSKSYTARFSYLAYLTDYTAEFIGFHDITGLEPQIESIGFTTERHPKQIILSSQSTIPIFSIAETIKYLLTTISIGAGENITLNNINNVSDIVFEPSATIGDYSEITILTTQNTPAGRHPLSLTIDGTTSDVFYLEITPAVHKIFLNQSEAYFFPEIKAGYNTIGDHFFTFQNTGNLPTGEIFISLEGAGKDNFIISSSLFTDVIVGEFESFGIRPKDGLYPGTYTAAVILSGTKINTESFNISFTVNSRTGNNVIGVLSPGEVKISGSNIMITVESDVSNLLLELDLSSGAAWKLYRDLFFTDEVSDKNLDLTFGQNMAFIKVTAENGSTNIYALSIYRKELLLSVNPGFSQPVEVHAGTVLLCFFIIIGVTKGKNKNNDTHVNIKS